MLSVCLIFLYVLLTAYLTGFFVLIFIERFCTGRKGDGKQGHFFQIKSTEACLFSGLAALTVYAQFFSLFYKVGFAANVILIVFCFLVAVIYFKPLKEVILRIYSGVGKGKIFFYIFLFFLFCYGTSRGISHYDTALYHAQSIRWIEEYGVVKGLGNLHCRLAYNSSAFSLSALFSFSFLGGQSYHCMAGFFALLLAKNCSKIGDAWKRRRMNLSDFARVMGIYYLLIIFDEMISPASDYFTVITIFYIVISWLELLERKEESWVPYGLLCLLGVYTMSLKLSAALVLLLVIKPAAMLIKEKNYRGIFSFLGLGILIILPYLLRNIIISGWLVYPFTVFDFFLVDWKIPKGIAQYDAKEIQVWGRNVFDVARYEDSFKLWFPAWFQSQQAMDRLFIAAGMLSVPVWLISLCVGVIKRKAQWYDWLLVAGTVDLSFLFWLLSAPLIRYGCVYVWLAPAVTFAGLCIYLIKNKVFWRLLYVAVCLLACYKLLAFGLESRNSFTKEYFINQKDYENFETKEYEISGHIFYNALQGDRTGYNDFPSSPVEADIVLRGDSLKEGFSHK